MSTFPSTPKPSSAKIRSNSPTFVSIAHNLRQVVSTRNAHRWGIELDFPPMKRADFAALWAFIVGQRGRAGSFDITLPQHAARGSWAGTPRVDGAGQTGRTIQLKGFTPSQPGVVKAGDFVRFSENLMGENRIENGNFSNGTTNWSFSSGISVPAITSETYWAGSQITITGSGEADGVYSSDGICVTGYPRFFKASPYASLYKNQFNGKWMIYTDARAANVYEQITATDWPWGDTTWAVIEVSGATAPAPNTPQPNLGKTGATFWDNLTVDVLDAGDGDYNGKYTFSGWYRQYPVFSLPGIGSVRRGFDANKWEIYSEVTAEPIYRASASTPWPWGVSYSSVGGASPAPMVKGWGAFYVEDGAAHIYVPKGTPGAESPLIFYVFSDVLAGEKYVIKFSAKMEKAGDTFRARANNYNGTTYDWGAVNVDYPRFEAGSTEWADYTMEITAAYPTDIRFLFAADLQENGGDAWIKNVSAYRVSPGYKTYMATADAASDAAGKASVGLNTPLVAASKGDALVYSDAKFRCSLADDNADTEISSALFYGFKVQLQEVLY
jgi:hypothetical protein